MDIDLDDVDPPTTKGKRKRVSTEISDRKKFNAFPEEDSDHNSDLLSAFFPSQFSGSQSSLPKKRDSNEIFDKHGKKFIAFHEEDSDHNSEVWSVWSAFTGSRSSLPKKGDLVVYFPQGHLESENSRLLLPMVRKTTKEEVGTYGLQPQIICRVEHVQLMIKEADDEICAKITLHPEPEVNSEEKELELSYEDEDCICDEDGSSATISTPSLFSKRLNCFDEIRSPLSIPPKAAIEFFCLDKESMDLQNEVTAKDFHGNEWKFRLIRDKKEGNWLLRWSKFAISRYFQEGERVVFLREKDTKLRFGIIRSRCRSYVRANDNPLSEAASAISKESIFSVMYGPRADHEDFVIPYQKYMKSITRPGFIGAKVHKQYRNSSTSRSGVVTGMSDLDPKNWPNSKWKCLLVTWGESSYEDRVSPWEIVFDDSSSPYTFDSSRTSTTKYKESKLKKLQTSKQDNPSPMPHLEKHKDLLSDETIRSIHCEKLKICSVDDLWRHLKENHSYEYLEFDSCSFPSSARIPIPVTIKKLTIASCIDTEQVFMVLMDPNLSVESLKIDSCSSFSSMSTGGIPATLGQLKIVNCMNLKSLSKSFKTKKSSSIGEHVHYSTGGTLQLRMLEIQNCVELEFLPKGLHKLRNLDILSINNCSSIEYFPEGGLPRTCLTSLSISECENLKCLPNKLHKVTSLQKLSISGCPSLMVFPEGGLPSNLVSLHIIDCENLISLSQWELHKLKHLRKYSFSCGY